MAARPMAKPAPTAESAGIQTPSPSAACAAVGVTSAAALSAAVGSACATGAWVTGGAATPGEGTKVWTTVAAKAAHATSTAQVVMIERGAAIARNRTKTARNRRGR